MLTERMIDTVLVSLNYAAGSKSDSILVLASSITPRWQVLGPTASTPA